MYLFNCCWSVDGVFKSCGSREIDKFSSLPVKRRLSAMGNSVLASLNFCIANANNENLVWVVASRFGDTEKMISLFNSLCTMEQCSPTDFSMSVHNALIGINSIQQKNTQMHTAISAGCMSFHYGLLEACSIALSSGKKTGFIYYDFPMPDIYNDHVADHKQKIVIAFIIDPAPLVQSEQASFFLKLDIAKCQDFSKVSHLIDFLNGDQQHLDFMMRGAIFNFTRIGSVNAD